MNKPTLIGLTGRQGAGKSTAADYLRQHHGYAGSSLTDPMDEMLAPLMRRMGVPEHEITPRLAGAMKNEPIPGYEWLAGRKLKQILGYEFRDAVSAPDAPQSFFLDLWFGDNASHPYKVNDQIRYAHEADQIRAHGGIVIHMVDPDATRDDNHPSEDIDFPVDHIVDNPKTGLAHLHAALDKIVGADASEQMTRTKSPLTTLDADIDEALNLHGPEIRAFADRLDAGDDDLSEHVDDIIADMKGRVGADAANGAADRDAEAAIDAAEAWITDNVSNSTSDRRIAAIYAQLGAEKAKTSLENGSE